MELEKLVEAISQQFVNLNTLHLDRMEEIKDSRLRCLSRLPKLDIPWLEGYRCRCEPFGGVAMPKRAQYEILLEFDRCWDKGISIANSSHKT